MIGETAIWLPAVKVVAGAAAGGVLGWLAGGVRVCSSEQCRARANRTFSTIAGACCGAALTWIALGG